MFEVRESPKTEAGNRDIILSSDAQKTLKEIRKMNPFGEYMFMSDGKRIKEKAFSVKMLKYADMLESKNGLCTKLEKHMLLLPFPLPVPCPLHPFYRILYQRRYH